MAGKKNRPRARGSRAPAPPDRAVLRLPGWVGPVLLSATFVALAMLTWRKWPDLLVDFGQQLYIPWRLADGARLYRDIAFLHGPLSQHVNALWFRAFGPSLTVLIIVNLGILAAIATMLYTFVRSVTDYLTATVAGFILLAVFGFSQYVGTGNYNYVTPYVHEATHGIALALGMMVLFGQYVAGGARRAIAGAGVCLGLAVLTKVDVATATMAVAAVALPAIWWLVRTERQIRGGDVALFAAGAAAPALLFFAYFLTYLPAGPAFKAVFGGFFAVSPEVARNTFYLSTMGFEDITGNSWKMTTMFAAIAMFVLAAAAANVAAVRVFRRPGPVGAILGTLLAVVLVVNPDLVPWWELPRALPLTTLAALATFAVAVVRSIDRRSAALTFLPMALWALFGLALLAKMLLHTRLDLYGFYLAMPAMILLAMCLVYWVPRALAERSGSGAVFRALSVGVLAAMVIYQVNWSQAVYARKDFVVGRGGDAIVTYGPDVFPPTAVTAAALQWIDTHMPATATFVAMPEGITLNYLTRRPTSVPIMNFMMTELIVFGEDVIVASLDAQPPDFVVLVSKDTSEFGVGPFGVDPAYGRRIMTWIDQHYDLATLIGGEPFRSREFGIKILKRAR